MTNTSTFTIYNASAGSGKTYTLVKEYLKVIFQSSSPLAFKTILALTFTNKAVTEMKERIIKTLQEFSDPTILSQSNDMFESLAEDLKIEPYKLHQKSIVILETIVHNYASFDISTIDKFNHKLIRTFAYDLKLPLNFEVELDTANLLSKAVDKLIDKAGTDDDLTKILVDFAIEKADNDKSWDVSHDFNIIAKLLVNENDIPYIETLNGKTLADFKSLKSLLSKSVAILETEILKDAQSVLDLIDISGLQFNDFSSGYLPKHFQKLVAGDFSMNFGLKWQTDLMEDVALYPKRVPNDVALKIESIKHTLLESFNSTKNQVLKHRFLKNVLKNSTPLSVLNAIKMSLKELKDEDDLLLISEFNALISNEIKNQPAPFIYERIGEKFKHYFIDEFQDTSQLQWENLIPLVSNALSGENLKGDTGTAMLVGDAKQSIYRWRGGKAEQFIDLYTNENPFFVKKRVENLPANYRSLRQIVAFNNSFFEHVSEFVFSSPAHKDIYESSHQHHTKEQEGYVELSFLDIKNSEEDEDKDVLHCQKVLQSIQKAQTNGFSLNDICIITRKSREGIAIANFLSEKNIPIVSSESLLLKNSPEVNFVNAIIALATQPTNDELKIGVLSYLAEHKLHLEDKHAFFDGLIRLNVFQLFRKLSDFDFFFNFENFIQLPLYEAVETIVRQFGLNQESNAYLQFYMDEILDYSQKHHASFLDFILHWDIKKEKLSVVSPQGNNAVQIMTIHKSKGLEFPVVIFPYANQELYFDMSPKVWFPVEKDNFSGFSHLFLNMNKDLQEIGEIGSMIYRNYRSELELDTINLLYVVMTRAVEQLYVISELDLGANQKEKLNLYSGLFIHYIKSIQQWSDTQHSYSFGDPLRKLKSTEKQLSVTQSQFVSTAKEDHNLMIVTNSGYLWDTEQEKAQEKGNLIHYIMAQIRTLGDIQVVMDDLYITGTLNLTQRTELKAVVVQIVNHPQLARYYEDNQTIYVEKDIITKDGQIVRPDRIVINTENEAVIIDYKTGNEKPSHMEQLSTYQSILEDMDYTISKKILVYINEDIQIKEF